MVPFPSWIRVLAVGSGHKHAAGKHIRLGAGGWGLGAGGGWGTGGWDTLLLLCGKKEGWREGMIESLSRCGNGLIAIMDSDRLES